MGEGSGDGKTEGEGDKIEEILNGTDGDLDEDKIENEETIELSVNCEDGEKDDDNDSSSDEDDEEVESSAKIAQARLGEKSPDEGQGKTNEMDSEKCNESSIEEKVEDEKKVPETDTTADAPLGEISLEPVSDGNQSPESDLE